MLGDKEAEVWGREMRMSQEVGGRELVKADLDLETGVLYIREFQKEARNISNHEAEALSVKEVTLNSHLGYEIEQHGLFLKYL